MWVELIDTCLASPAARLQTVQYFVEDFVRYHRDKPSMKYVFRELKSRIQQYMALIAEFKEEIENRAVNRDDPIIEIKLIGMVRAIAGYAQFIDLWNAGGVTCVVAAQKDAAYIFQGRE